MRQAAFRRVISALMLLFLVIRAFAFQTSAARNICLREGLSNGYVTDMAFDKNGFLWVATESGLNRITGSKCTVFNTANSNISNDEIVGLCYHPRSNTLWLYDKQGMLSVFDGNSLLFSHPKVNGTIPHDISAIALAADSALWIAHDNGDITHYDPLTGKEYTISHRHFPWIHHGVRSIADDGKGNLYIGLRMEGLIIYNKNTRKARYFCQHTNDPASIPGNNVRVVFFDGSHHVWVGTNGGLALYNPTLGKFKVFNQTGEGHLAGNNIQHIAETKDGKLLISSDIGGISILDGTRYPNPWEESLQFSRLTHENSPLSSDNVRRVSIDAYGNLWVGNYSTGVDFFAASPSPFQMLALLNHPVSNVMGLYTDSKGNLWIGQDNTIIQCRNGMVVRQWNFSRYLFNSSASVYTFCEDKEGCIWFGTSDNGAMRLNPSTGVITPISITRHMDVNALFADSKGKMWIGTENGIYSVDRGIEKYELAVNQAIGLKSLPFAIEEDFLGRLWIGTMTQGCMVVTPDGKLIAKLRGMASNSITQILQGESGGMWIATYKGLVSVPDTRRPQQTLEYGRRQGLRDSHVCALAEDSQGNLWLGTLSGIACFNLDKRTFSYYDLRSGVPMGNFATASATVLANGTVCFGSPEGVCYFNPMALAQGRKVSPVRIIDCERLRSQNDTSGSLLFHPDETGKVTIRHHENMFKIAFTVVNYAEVADVEYAYQLKGQDNRWYDTYNENAVTFRDLAPGKYVFCVRAKLRNQGWEQARYAELPLVITPPLWQTWWANLVYFLMMAAICYFLIRSYLRQRHLHESLARVRWENSHRQELNEERLRFFTNITHELRTPLTLILGPLDDLIADNRLPQVLAKKVATIHASAQHLLGLINELLEFRKVETQNRQISVARADLGAFVLNAGRRFQDLNRNPKLHIAVTVPSSPVMVFFDSEVVTTVVNNLMSNAIKYTQQGEVELLLIDEGERVVLQVRDTGYGISPEALPHIFDRYYQAKGLHQASGAGIGLALVKSLSDLHHAQLAVESKEGKGSCFSFALLKAETYPKAFHKDDEPIVAAEEEGLDAMEDKEQDEHPLVLVVEDNDDILQYINESLCEDYRTLLAHNGKEGARLAFEQTPDIIVSDIMMPEMDGIEMTRLLKEDIRTCHIPIILLTAKTTQSDQEEGYDSGADSYLTKPFSSRLLQSRIRNLLSSRRRLAEFVLQREVRTSMLQTSGNDEEVTVDHEQTISPQTEPMLSPLDKKFMEKLNRIIDENLSTEDIDMGFMTDKMAMSHSTFYRKVKALTGVSANEYIRKVKLTQAMAMLRSGEHNASETAMLTGFNSLGYFRRCFKKEFGILPSEVLQKK